MSPPTKTSAVTGAEPLSSLPTTSFNGNAFTWRAIWCAFLLGIGVYLINMYFGLQAAMIEVMAGSLGVAPFTSGLTSLIPALEFLVNSVHDVPLRFSTTQLLIWSLSTCGLGIVASAPFRGLFNLRERLRLPSTTATGTLIGILFDRKDIIAHADPSHQANAEPESHESQTADTTALTSYEINTSEDENKSNVRILLFSLVGSGMFAIVSYVAPFLRRVPLFGRNIANTWLWTFDLSPAYLGYGIIIGPTINAYTLLGAVIGWGILSPLAKNCGWAPGPVDDFANGSPTPIAVVMIPLAALISIRSLGETDNGALLAIGRLAQFAVALVVPPSSATIVSTNLLLSGAVESGASQASQHMGGLWTACMTNAEPRAVFYGQMLGSYVGPVVAVILYKIYTSIKDMPSQEFGIPDAYLHVVMSRSIRQGRLPPKAMTFSLVAFVAGAIFSAHRIAGQSRWWRYLIPSGVAMSLGMYVVPSITLPRAFGGLVSVFVRGWHSNESFTLICCATELILGQGLLSVVGLLLDELRR
ncbi:oligopeptide transporter [Fusarium austroafricanum]|uniref:Oligopeptide transporter n=1 Tax=Fusarium austroafricanum TaxID=2364996 RepID=A0A8H4NJ97_9HYPO|nr:oligopeptide transporter [Fusarium austroafricanum]